MEQGTTITCDLCGLEFTSEDRIVQKPPKEYHTVNSQGRKCWWETLSLGGDHALKQPAHL